MAGEAKTNNMEDFIYSWLAEIFDVPCDYSFDCVDVALFMVDNCAEWCENNCSSGNTKECWKKYLTTVYEKKKEKETVTWN